LGPEAEGEASTIGVEVGAERDAAATTDEASKTEDEAMATGDVPPTGDDAVGTTGEVQPTEGEAAATKGDVPPTEGEAAATTGDVSPTEGETAATTAMPTEARAAQGEPFATQGDPAQPPPGTRERERRDRGWWWWALLAIALVVEFWMFGRRGEIQVCVGKAEVHRFELLGKARTDENRWAFPRCEKRLNLGLRSSYDAQVADATKAACRGATLFKLRKEGKPCEQATDGWKHRVRTEFVPPWDARYRRELFWFFY